MADVLEPGVVIKPQMDKTKAIEFVWELFGLKAENVKEFNSYDDRNFYFKVDPESEIENPYLTKETLNLNGYMLKVTNILDSKNASYIEAQNQMIVHMAKSDLEVPVPVKNKNGLTLSLEELEVKSDNSWESNNDEKAAKKIVNKHLVRLLNFIPGKILYDIQPWLPRHFYEAGVFAAKMDNSLKSFEHPAYEGRNNIWYLNSIPQVKNFLHAVQDETRRKMCKDIFDAFEKEVLGKIDELEVGIIHGDFNEQNILVRQMKNDPDQWEIFSVIDFGDTNKNPIIFELGITIMYMMTQCKSIHPNEAGGHVLAGYETIRTLPPIEMEVLRLCAAARYAQSLVMGAYSHQQDPTNDYLLVTASTGWTNLTNFWNVSQEDLYKKWTEIKESYQ